MAAPNPRPVSTLPRPILAIFFISGASALIDQIVWTRSLHRVFGVTAPAAATVLAAFMAGLALGSWLFGRWADRGRSPLRLYAAMELAIAIMAPLTPWIFRGLQPVYVALARSVGLESPWLAVLRGLLCVLVLLPPTALMGGTLPVLVKGFFRGEPGRVVASLYAINTWGAVVGCFLCGFVLLGWFGETRSLVIAAIGNLVAAGWAWRTAAKSADNPPAVPALSPALPAESHGLGLILTVSFINGFGALALEVLWGRTLGIFTDSSVYAFTCIIGVFLVGIALGSRVAGTFADRVRSPLTVLGIMVMAMGLGIGLTLRSFIALMAQTEPGSLMPTPDRGALGVFLFTMLLATAAVAPITLLSGACFPIFARLAMKRPGHEGADLGRVYSINTIGGILGAALGAFAMLPLLHDQGSFLLIAVLYLVGGAACLFAAGRRGAALASLAVTGAIAFMFMPPGRSLSRDVVARYGVIASHVESPSGTVTAFARPNGLKSLLVNGTGMTILCTDTKLMAHLPLLLHPNPQNILVICFGMGSTFRAAATHPVGVTAVELQPAVPQAFGYFHPDGPALLNDPKNRIRIGDGRNYLLVSDERFSVITIDPAPPMHSAGTVNLYTREFFELCRDHLEPDGIISLWIPNEACTEADFKLIVRTFHSVFPQIQLYAGPDGFGYYLIGSLQPIIARPERIRQIIDNPRIRADVSEYRSQFVSDWFKLAALYLMGRDGLERYIADEQRMLTDDRPYTEFPLGSWLRISHDPGRYWMGFDKLKTHIERPDPAAFPDR